ncbi:MAG: aldehyde-activating protein [Pseudomonadales bacterium]|nr:aldehyde-activating protein [Pseudomonadales bacterium]
MRRGHCLRRKKPEFVHDCNCSLCRKSGAIWGYFSSAGVAISGETISFVRRDKQDPRVELHACKTCAVTVYFKFTPSIIAQNPMLDQIGVNTSLFSLGELKGIEMRFPDGENWSGLGAFEYRRAPIMM